LTLTKKLFLYTATSNLLITLAKVYAHMIDELKAKTDNRIEEILDTL